MVRTRLWWRPVAIVAAFFAITGVALAAGDGAISQSYTATSAIAQGTLLSLTASGSNTVEAAQSGTKTANLVGVAAESPLVELSANGKNSVQVVVGGATPALVSDINGPVKAGDKITVSPINGVGMKATTAAATVGVAQASLSSVATVTKSVTGKNGKPVTVKIGLVPLAVNIAYYSATQGVGTTGSWVPPIFQTAANSITGKQVSPTKVLVAALALILGFAICVIMMTTSIRSEIISLGRNPLARATLLRGLVDVLIAACGVLFVSLAAAFLVIWI